MGEANVIIIYEYISRIFRVQLQGGKCPYTPLADTQASQVKHWTTCRCFLSAYHMVVWCKRHRQDNSMLWEN